MSAVAVEGLYISCWIIFFVRLLLCAAYGLVQFIGKPGSRLIVPALLTGAAYAERLQLEKIINAHLYQLSWERIPPTTIEVIVAAGLATLTCVCVVLWPCVFYARYAVAAVFDLFGIIVIFTAFLTFIGLGAVFYFDIPINAGLLDYLPLGLARYVPTEWPAYLFEARTYDLKHLPETELLQTAMAISVMCLNCLYIVFSRIIILLLGAFPPITRPLAPMRPLKVTKPTLKPVPVSIAVPKLPRRRPSLT